MTSSKLKAQTAEPGFVRPALASPAKQSGYVIAGSMEFLFKVRDTLCKTWFFLMFAIAYLCIALLNAMTLSAFNVWPDSIAQNVAGVCTVIVAVWSTQAGLGLGQAGQTSEGSFSAVSTPKLQ